jgi:hypothetical protein
VNYYFVLYPPTGSLLIVATYYLRTGSFSIMYRVMGIGGSSLIIGAFV